MLNFAHSVMPGEGVAVQVEGGINVVAAVCPMPVGFSLAVCRDHRSAGLLAGAGRRRVESIDQPVELGFVAGGTVCGAGFISTTGGGGAGAAGGASV